MINRSVENNTLVFYLYKLLINSSMRGPILVIFMTKYCGMPLSEVYFCEACCVTLAVVLQIPTGILADKWGRAKTIRVGCFILTMELVCFACSTEHILLWIGNALWAIGYSLISNADTALLYDSLKEKIKSEKELETKYRTIEGKSLGFALLSSAILCLFSGYLSEINIRIPLVIDTVIIFAVFITTFWFTETTKKSSHDKKSNIFSHTYEKIVFVFQLKHVLWIISFATLIGVSSKLWFFTYNPYFEMVGLDVKYFGLVFAALNITAFVTSFNANKIAGWLNGAKGIALSIGILTIPMIVMGTFVSKWSIGLVLCQNLVRGYLSPFVNNMINKRIESSDRTTILSVKSAIYQAVEVVCMTVFGLIISKSSLSSALTCLGIIASLFGLVLTYYYVKLFRK
jgi:MFS family permease